MNTPASKPKLKILVSSTVYGVEELLDRVYALLIGYGYEVWMSHKGTFPVRSNRSAFDDSLAAVDECDLFLGIITPQYGSGQDKIHDPDGLSIFHREIRRAIELKKPRWILAHENVVFARLLLNKLGHKGKEGREPLRKLKITHPVDLRVLDVYEEVIKDKESIPVGKRIGNWAQKFHDTKDASVFVDAQFFRYQEVEKFVEENFSSGSPLLREGGEK